MSTDALSARLQPLEDERSILQTLDEYGHSMDYGHLVMDSRIVVTGDEATGQSSFLRVEPQDAGQTQIVASGRYLDRLVRRDDGHWRFTERIAEIDDM